MASFLVVRLDSHNQMIIQSDCFFFPSNSRDLVRYCSDQSGTGSSLSAFRGGTSFLVVRGSPAENISQENLLYGLMEIPSGQIAGLMDG